MGPAEIKPYVELLTWQVVAVLGGVFLIPAVYVLMFQITEFDIFGVKGKIKPKEAAAILKDADEEVESEIGGAEAVETLEVAAETEAETPRDRLESAMKVWSAVAFIVRDLAVQHGSQHPHATQTSAQIKFLKEHGKITAAQASRASGLLSTRNGWRRNPSKPIESADFKSFVMKSRRLGTELSRLIQPKRSDAENTSVAASQTAP